MDRFRRLKILIDEKQQAILDSACVMVVGIGGVGAMVCEALARSAIKTLIIVDHDLIQITNINRQIHATQNTLDLKKVQAMADRITQINPECKVIAIDRFFDKESVDVFSRKIDFVVDAIDTISCKLDLIQACHNRQIPIISCLGMGNRFDPSKLIYSKLYKSEIDPLAKAMRYQARQRKIDYDIDVVLSKEIPLKPSNELVLDDDKNGKAPPGSTAFVPNAAGLMLASYVVRSLIKKGL